jgi:hypothetical protein
MPDRLVCCLTIAGGYFRRFKGGALSRWVGNPGFRDRMTLEERTTLAFLEVSHALYVLFSRFQATD